MKKALQLFLLISFSLTTFTKAQETYPTSSSSNYRIHTSYIGCFLSLPTTGLKKYVTTGGGVKYGSLFELTKNGFVNGLINVGIKAEWINAEGNLPYNANTDNDAIYALAFVQRYGPMITIKPKNNLYIDAYYTPGWGFRIFGNSDAPTTNDIDPNVPHVRFAQAVGFNVRYKVLYAGFNLQSIANPKYVNGAYVNQTATLQLTVGVCNWHIK